MLSLFSLVDELLQPMTIKISKAAIVEKNVLCIVSIFKIKSE
jgi:hypothetical protein